MKILFTGGTSLSGYWIYNALFEAGHSVDCTLTKKQFSDYETDKSAQRVQRLKNKINPIFDAAFGSQKFCQQIEKTQYDFICLHGAHIPNYKSPDFNIEACIQNNLFNYYSFKIAL